MLIHVHYWNQIRDARGLQDEVVQLDGEAKLSDLLERVAQHENMEKLLFDNEGQVSPWILIDRAGDMVRDTSIPLTDGDVVRLSTHISGG